MEETQKHEIFLALDNHDPERAAKILSDAPDSLDAIYLYPVAEYALRRLMGARGTDLCDRALAVFRHVLHCARQTENRDCLTSALITAVNECGPDMTLLLLEAGADPNALYLDHEHTAFFYAVKYDDIDMVRLLFQFGADPQHPAHKKNATFKRALRSSYRIYWYLLFKRELGLDDVELATIFGKGSPHSIAERNAIAERHLTESQCLHLWRLSIAMGGTHAAVGFVTGYCDGVGITPDSPAGVALLEQLLGSLCDLLALPKKKRPNYTSEILDELAFAGFQFTNTSDEVRERLLAAVLNIGDERALHILFNSGIRPLIIAPENPGGAYACPALDLAIVKGLKNTVIKILLLQNHPFAFCLSYLQRFIEENNHEMLDTVCEMIQIDPDVQIDLLTFAIIRRRRVSLAILVQSCCSPANDVNFHPINATTYRTFCLSQALILQEGEDPLTTDRFDCVQILLSESGYDKSCLQRLCNLIILHCAKAGDLEGVKFLCRHGFPPLLLLDHFRTQWALCQEPTPEMVLLIEAVIEACSGLHDFAESILRWRIQKYIAAAIDSFALGTGQLSSSEFLENLLDTNVVGVDVFPDPLPDMRFIHLLCTMGDHETPSYPYNVQHAVKRLLKDLHALLKRRYGPPTLFELAMDNIPEFLDERSFSTIRHILEMSTNSVVTDELLDVSDPPLSLLEILTSEDLRQDPELMPYFFAEEDMKSESTSSDSFYYNENDE